eukprot:1896988-Amphidinium_carterae.1
MCSALIWTYHYKTAAKDAKHNLGVDMLVLAEHPHAIDLEVSRPSKSQQPRRFPVLRNTPNHVVVETHPRHICRQLQCIWQACHDDDDDDGDGDDDDDDDVDVDVDVVRVLCQFEFMIASAST